MLALLRDPGRIVVNAVVGGDEVDLYLPDRGAVIEVDSELHDNPAARRHDAAKTEHLEARGLRTYRLR